MTRTISLITATVGAALLFAVPAYGDNWGADKASSRLGVSPDWFERAAAAAVQKQDLSTMLNARERALGAAISQTPTVFDARSDGTATGCTGSASTRIRSTPASGARRREDDAAAAAARASMPEATA